MDDGGSLFVESVATAVSMDGPSGTKDKTTCQDPLGCVIVTP